MAFTEHDRTQPKAKGGMSEKGNNGRDRERFSVTLSPAAAKAFHELKEATDADTDSEVFRNALRLHVALIRAYKDGKKLYLEDDKDKTLVPVSLFAPAD